MTLRALIVDDEAPARAGLKALLMEHGDLSVIGECGDGRSAVRAIRQLKPDVLFLDIRMPDLDGFTVLDALGDAPLPATAFVTAYDEHALRAFEANAVDYLVKPFDPARLSQCVARLRRFARRSDAADRYAAARADWERGREGATNEGRIPVRENGRLKFVDPDDIQWLETRGNYVALHTGKTHSLVRGPLSEVLTRLDPNHFLRISRFSAVNLDRVREATPLASGGYAVLLENGDSVDASRRYAAQITARFRESRG